MKVKLVQIGNSRGIRIPKALINHMKLNGTLELEIREDELVLRSPAKPPKKPRRAKDPRAGWEKIFRDWIAKNGPIPELTADERDFLDTPNECDEKEPAW